MNPDGSFDVLIEADNRMYVGIGPFSEADVASFPPDYLAVTITDDTTFGWLMDHCLWPPYAHLGDDGQTFDLVDEWPTPAP